MRELIESRYDHELWLAYKRDAGIACSQMILQYGILKDKGLFNMSSLVPLSVRYGGVPAEDIEKLDEICASGTVTLQEIFPIPASKYVPNAELVGDFGDWFFTLRLLAIWSRDMLNGPWNDWGIDLAHDFMRAGEWAVWELVRYGFVTPEKGGGNWTEAGRALLEDAGGQST